MTTVRTTGLELPLPDGWSDRTVVTVAAPVADDGYVANVVVTREPLCAHMGLHGFADGYARRLDEYAGEIVLLAQEESEVDGARAVVRVLRVRLGDEQPLMQLHALWVHGGCGYALCGTSSVDGFADAEPAFRAMLAGMRLHELAASTEPGPA